MILSSAFRPTVPMRRAIGAIVVIVTVASAAGAETVRPIPDDAALAARALSERIGAALAGLPLAGARSTILPLPGAIADSLAERAAIRALLDRGAEVCPRGTCACDGARSDPGGCWRLRYDVVQLRVDYRREGWIFRADRIRRHLRADLAWDVVDPADRIVRADAFAIEVADVIPARRADDLASPLVPRREIARSHRLLQGVAAVAVIAALVIAAR